MSDQENFIHNASHIIDLTTWVEQPAGQYICAWEQQIFDEWTSNIFGFHALQIGLPHIHALRNCRISNQWQSEAHFHQRDEGNKKRVRIDIAHEFSELPFQSQSMDLIVLPHVLEFSKHPHQVLREVERVLIPEGRLIISGFNPLSSWGLRQALGGLTQHHFFPKEGKWIRAYRLKDWFDLLALEVLQSRYGCYALPVGEEDWFLNTRFSEKMGSRFYPYLGAVYVFEVVKRVKGMHLIGPALKQKKRTQFNAVVSVSKSNNIDSP